MAAQRAFLIDASIYIFRAWFSLPDQWHTRDGWPLNAVYGYTRFLLAFLEQQQPIHCALAFDESLGSCFRNEIYSDYKASRELPDEALAFQLKTCREVTETLGLPCYGGERYEADDYLATLACFYRKQGIPVSIVTRDKDLGQIIQGADDRWWDYAADVVLDAAGFKQKYGVRPDQFADYLALVGDPVDDIPGVPGVGAKTAAALLEAFENLEGLLAGMERVGEMELRGAAGLGEKLSRHWSTIEISRSLTGLEEAVPGLDDIPQYTMQAGQVQALASHLEQINLQGPLTRRCENLARSLAP